MSYLKSHNNVLLPDYGTCDDENACVISDAELLKHMINFCYVQHGATITITIKHDNGNQATAKLFDHVVLLEGLYKALENFQAEL